MSDETEETTGASETSDAAEPEAKPSRPPRGAGRSLNDKLSNKQKKKSRDEVQQELRDLSQPEEKPPVDLSKIYLRGGALVAVVWLIALIVRHWIGFAAAGVLTVAGIGGLFWLRRYLDEDAGARVDPQGGRHAGGPQGRARAHRHRVQEGRHAGRHREGPAADAGRPARGARHARGREPRQGARPHRRSDPRDARHDPPHARRDGRGTLPRRQARSRQAAGAQDPRDVRGRRGRGLGPHRRGPQGGRHARPLQSRGRRHGRAPRPALALACLRVRRSQRHEGHRACREEARGRSIRTCSACSSARRRCTRSSSARPSRSSCSLGIVPRKMVRQKM